MLAAFCAQADRDANALQRDEQHGTWEGFSFEKEITRLERNVIERALLDAGGSVTRAAQLLGFKHHQSLIWRLNRRHKDLISSRSEVRPRKRSIILRNRNKAHQTAGKDRLKMTILHVEEHQLIASRLKEMLVNEGLNVDNCVNGTAALRMLKGKAHYDLVILDNNLPGLNGLELVRRVRKMPHRRRTPIVMLSGTDCETEAWAARVDAYLRKPQDILKVSSTITRLLRAEIQDE